MKQPNTFLKVFAPATLASVAFLCVSYAPHAHAAGAITVGEPVLSGDCSRADTEGVLNGSGDYEVRFTNLFAAASAPEADAQRTCDVEVPVTPPRGFALAINGALLEGAARTRNGGQASVFQSYSIENAPGSFSGQNSGTFKTNAAFDSEAIQPFEQKLGPWADDASKLPAEWRGACGRETRVRGKVQVAAFTEGTGSAEIYADRALLGGSSSLFWNWELVPCDDGNNPSVPQAALNGAYQFQYLAANGRTVTGRMTVQREGGSYRAAGASWTGTLKDLRSEGGSVKGTWEALGGNGWVAFTPDADGQGFHGEWGFDGAASVGFWNGQKE